MDETSKSLERYVNWQAPETVEGTQENQAAQSAFNEWCQLNSVTDTGIKIESNLTPEDKAKHYDAIFREGSKKLMAELRNPADNEIKLVDKLEISKLKAELNELREQGNMGAVGKREAEIANIFQEAVSQYPYQQKTCHVTQILNKKEMNCVGASVLGGVLLDEVGIKYLVGHIGSHVFLVTATSDGKVYWQDMQDGKEAPELNNEELTTEKIEGQNIEEVSAFANNPQIKGMTLFVKKEHWKNKALTLLPPEFGLELNVLINTGFGLGNSGKNRESIQVLEVAKQKDPGNPDIYLGLSRAYKNLKLYPEAIDSCNKALEVEPRNQYLLGLQKELVDLENAK